MILSLFLSLPILYYPRYSILLLLFFFFFFFEYFVYDINNRYENEYFSDYYIDTYTHTQLIVEFFFCKNIQQSLNANNRI